MPSIATGAFRSRVTSANTVATSAAARGRPCAMRTASTLGKNFAQTARASSAALAAVAAAMVVQKRRHQQHDPEEVPVLHAR